MSKDKNKNAVEAWSRFLDEDVGIVQDEKLVFVSSMDTGDMPGRAEFLEFIREGVSDPESEASLAAAMERLTCLEETVLRGLYWKDMGTARVAEELKIGSEAVRMTKSRALKKLRKIMSSQRPNVTTTSPKNLKGSGG